MKILFPLFVFLLINSILVTLNNNLSFSSSFPSSLIFVTIIMFFFGLIDNLKIGVYLIVFISLIGLIILIYRCLVKIDKEYIERYFDLGFFAVIVLYIVICIINLNRGFNFVDEFSFWGASVEENIRLGKLYVVNESNLSYSKDYFPFYQLFETLWCYLSGGFAEAYCYRALSFFTLSLFIPLFSLIYENKIIKSIALVFTVLLSGLVVCFTNGMFYNTLFYNSIYIDWHIAFLMAYCLYIISIQNNSNSIYLLLSLIALILTKQASVVYWVMLMIIYIVITIKNRKNIKDIFLLICVPLVFYFMWNLKVSQYNIDIKFSSSDFQFGTLINYLNGSLDGYRIEIVNKFFRAVVFEPVVGGIIKLSFLMAIILITILLLIINKFIKLKNGYIIAFGYFIGSFFYLYAVLLAYLYSFDYAEAIGLTMYSRYILIYVVFGIIYVLYVLTSFFLENSKYGIVLCIIYTLLFVSKDTIIDSLPALEYSGVFNDNYYRFKGILNEIDDDSKVIIIYQNDPVKLMALKYYGIESEEKIDFIDICDGNLDNQIGTPFWKEDLLDLFKRYDYVYICDIDDSIYNLWDSVTNVPCKVDHMYKIEEVNEKSCKMTLLYEDF